MSTFCPPFSITAQQLFKQKIKGLIFVFSKEMVINAQIKKFFKNISLIILSY